jgi:acetyl esterase/lipase
MPVQLLSLRQPVLRLSHLAGPEGHRFQAVDPASAESYTGILVIDKDICPAPTGATWHPSRPSSASDTGKVILHFHGGAYVLGDG